MLPRNAVSQERERGRVEVSVVAPVAPMRAVENPALAETAGRVRGMLRQAVAGLGAAGTARPAAVRPSRAMART